MAQLAINGGEPVIKQPLPAYNSIGKEEMAAVNQVMNSGRLSQFVGAWGEDFNGGPFIQEFEQAWTQQFKVPHAITVNSATSGLFAAMGAIGISPGDEVIVPPYTMSATVMAPLIYGGIPVFADIEDQTFCLDVEQVKAKINPRTKAIIAVNLFGHPAKLSELKSIADKHGIWLIEDNAQSPLATENGQYAGTIGHIGVFSLNYHKHIHTGEGGVIVTRDDKLALRLRMIRNHGENAIEASNVTDLTNLVGFNYRKTELGAAIGKAQLSQIDHHVGKREALAKLLSEGIAGLPGLIPPAVRDNCRHVYYLLAIRYDEKLLGISRLIFSKALAAEGFPNVVGYVKPLYLLPLFQKRIAIGSNGFPFSLSSATYNKGLCPVVERLHEKELFWFHNCNFEVGQIQAELLIEAIRKVHTHRHELSNIESVPQTAGVASV
jgi:perosamine synthetase